MKSIFPFVSTSYEVPMDAVRIARFPPVSSPEAFPSILWKDGSRSAAAAELMKITARELKELGVIERVIPETFRGEPLTQAAIVKRLKADLIYKLKELSSKELPELLEARYQRFRKY